MQFYADNLVARPKLLDGNTGVWVYTTDKFMAVYLVAKCLEAGNTLRQFADDIRIPDRLRT